MAATKVCLLGAGFTPVVAAAASQSAGNLRTNRLPNMSRKRLAVSAAVASETIRTSATENKRGGERAEGNEEINLYLKEMEKKGGETKKGLKDYFDESEELIRSDGRGPPRWFSPLECGCRLDNSPLLLFLPGIDGVGLGLIKHHHSLGKIFDIWCLHIPTRDRTSFTGLVALVERSVRSEYRSFPNRPIYLVGESLGACIALAVAARNPDIDLLLVLANPATSFEKSMVRTFVPLLERLPDQYQPVPYILSLMTGDPLRMVMDNTVKGVPPQQIIQGLSQDFVAMSSYLNVLADILPRETLLWKLEMLKSASLYANARLSAITAQTLILSSGRDQFLPSIEEGQRLSQALAKCENRRFNDSGHFLFLEDGIDLGTIIKGAATFYRRGKYHDYVSDFVEPTPPEFKKLVESFSLFRQVTSPVMLSTLADGKVVKGLSGIPSEGPVLFVGYHMLQGLELGPMISAFLLERNILLRGIAHPMLFMRKQKGGILPPVSEFDYLRLMGAVPVSGSNFFKLLSSKSHVLLYPGGVREACHRKGEQYKLFWPEQSEFVRMAARFGAKIVPFGVVGEDDFGEIVFDYDDQMKIPFLRNLIKDVSEEVVKARTEGTGQLAMEEPHFVGVLPKLPGRFYYYFGTPIETEGRKQELRRDREKAQEVYLQVKSEVENCMEFLLQKRENDPYRNILARAAYQATHGFNSEVPTFEL